MLHTAQEDMVGQVTCKKGGGGAVVIITDKDGVFNRGIMCSIFQGCQRNVEDWQKILQVRSLVLTQQVQYSVFIYVVFNSSLVCLLFGSRRK